MIQKDSTIYELHENGDARYLTFRRLDGYSELRHLFTTRWGGRSTGPCENWNLGYGTGNDPDTPENREYNVAVLANCMGTTADRTVWTQQTHTVNIRKVTVEDAGKGATRERGYTDVDGLVTDQRDLALVTLHADCNALYFYDPVRHVIGLAHSGWMGTLNGIATEMLELMKSDYGCDPSDIICGIGPSLCQDCFEVDEDVAVRFFDRDPGFREFAYSKVIPGDAAGDAIQPSGIRKYYIDLWAVNRSWMERAGVKPENILCMELCTKENTDTFFSHRGQGGKRGLMAASMMLKG